ncbi:hypothetical protein Ahy_B08g092766 [Arachis hypogaea]|uniref:SWIM-type domain-containing protein n=2 Tax=Arachis TaxID=3817 RepID=A0A444Y4H7_ARAHY|nr:hypothetical protein Ahy_B08g092766 [Arachis hypogaea]
MMAARQSCQVIGLMVGAPIREMGNDLNELEEPLTEEGDSGHSDSEYDGRDGGGSYMHAAAEDHANSENVMGKQFSCPDPVIASVLLSAEFNGIGDAYASYVANQQGLREKKHYERVDRKRTHKPETRTNCNAKIVVFLDKSCRKWGMKTLVEEHNHELAPQEFTNVMAPHRKIPEGHKVHIHSMHDAGFKTTQIMGFFAHMCGGYRNLNFISKDLYWVDMITSFGLEDNDWVAKTYEKREMWANAYLCEKFCAGIGTISRCEGINSSLKKFIKSGNCLLELVKNLDRVVKDYRNNEFIADYKTLYSNPVLTMGLEALERSVSKFYTREIFYEVLHRDSIGGTEKFMFRKYQKPYHVYSVFVDRSCDKYECSCKLWERLEIPCCHIFCVLKELEKEELLSRLVLRRWCKDAKVADSSSQHASVSPTDGFRVRYSALWSACLSLCFTAAQCTETYNTTITEVARMSREFESLGGIGQRSSRVQVGADETHILDPKIIRSKGAPRGSTNANNGRRCRRCLRFGHDRRNCTAMDDDVVDEDGGSGCRPVYTSGKRSRRK